MPLTAEGEPLRKRPWPDLVMPDGRRFVFYGNVSPPLKPSGAYEVRSNNMFEINFELARAGAVFLPETAATNIEGKELDTKAAIYVDERIGNPRILDFKDWCDENAGDILSSDNPRVPARGEIAELVRRGLAETGLADVVAQIKLEDAAQNERPNDPYGEY